MPEFNLFQIIAASATLTAIILAVLYFLALKKISRLQLNTSQQVLDEANRKAQELISQASVKAQEIVSKAEADSLSLVSNTKSEVQEVESSYNQQLKQSTENAANEFSQGLKTSLDQFSGYLHSLQTSTQQVENSSQEYAKERVAEVIEKFEQNLTSFLTTTQQHSSEAIELELKSARQLIDTYKAQQLTLIDENLIAILEKTISLVLAKRLSLQDHLDLVYGALEKAKLEKFIV